MEAGVQDTVGLLVAQQRRLLIAEQKAGGSKKIGDQRPKRDILLQSNCGPVLLSQNTRSEIFPLG